MTTSVNQTIEITSLGFSRRPQNPVLEAFPKRMVWEDREYTFVEIGMHFLIKKGQELIRLFDVSDGQNDYRLKCDSSNHWTLVSMRAAA
ncbi:MAG: hypothetical protein JWN82_249 [Candidatus Saccharibacteria bacterium]|nr:hypothetical protein [Candidatus Saccharibacteria bacterium]